MTKVETSPLSHLTFRQALARGLGDPINGLYATNASAPLQEAAGIRQVYKYGLYSYCGYLNGSAGACSNSTFGNKYLPYNDILEDMSLNYSALTIFIINGTSSFTSQSIGSHTRSASYLILIGTICAFLAFVMWVAILYLFPYCPRLITPLSGVYKHTIAFFISGCLAILATIFILTAAALWTTAINTSESVNGLILNTTNIPLGIEVSSGPGLSLLWAAVGLLIASLVPYLIRSDSPLCLVPTKRLIWFSLFLQLLHLPRLGGYNHISGVFHSFFVHPMTCTYHYELCLKHANDLTYDLGTLMDIRATIFTPS